MLFYPYVWEAMLGKGEYQQLYDGSITELKRSGALLTRANKRYVSAVVVIHKATKEAVFVHNPNANISLLKSKFRELFSNHYVANFSSKGLEWEKI
jgi:hypothetical protein